MFHPVERIKKSSSKERINTNNEKYIFAWQIHLFKTDTCEMVEVQPNVR